MPEPPILWYPKLCHADAEARRSVLTALRCATLVTLLVRAELNLIFILDVEEAERE